MKILFLMKHFMIGGIEQVTQVLANKFIQEGHQVVVVAFADKCTFMNDKFDKRVSFYSIKSSILSISTYLKLSKIMSKHEINILINQWGLPVSMGLISRLVCIKNNISLISVYHSNPQKNARIESVKNRLAIADSYYEKYIFRLLLLFYTLVTSLSMRSVYILSDKYVVLSTCYFDIFKRFTHINNISKLISISNPIADFPETQFRFNEKQKEILFVGRIEEVSKKVSRLVDIWSVLYAKYPLWTLTIVGDGQDFEMLKAKIGKSHLPAIRLIGFSDPIQYYKESSILLLTSDYEGFGLVIVEGMKFGVVPVVYESFEAVHDIIQSGINGIIVPRGDSFSFNLMAEKISQLIDNPQILKSMSFNAIASSEKFSVDSIYKEWKTLFNSIS